MDLAARMALGMPPDNNQEQRMLEQHLGLAWCGSAVERAEREQGRTFEVVAFIRPDLHLPYPLPPWCAFPFKTYIVRVRGAWRRFPLAHTEKVPESVHLTGGSAPAVQPVRRSACEPRAQLGASVGTEGRRGEQAAH